MTVERVALVLGEDADPQVAGVDQIGQHEVDQAVGTAERNCGLGAVGGERHQPLPLPARKDDAEHVTVGHVTTLVGALGCRLC